MRSNIRDTQKFSFLLPTRGKKFKEAQDISVLDTSSFPSRLKKERGYYDKFHACLFQFISWAEYCTLFNSFQGTTYICTWKNTFILLFYRAFIYTRISFRSKGSISMEFGEIV